MKVQQNTDGKWTVVGKGGEVLGTYETIKAAMDARFELQQAGKPSRKVQYFKADGTEVTRKPRQRAA